MANSKAALPRNHRLGVTDGIARSHGTDRDAIIGCGSGGCRGEGADTFAVAGIGVFIIGTGGAAARRGGRIPSGTKPMNHGDGISRVVFRGRFRTRRNRGLSVLQRQRISRRWGSA